MTDSHDDWKALEGNEAPMALGGYVKCDYKPLFGVDLALSGDSKSVETCHIKFTNIMNFKGFPVIPESEKSKFKKALERYSKEMNDYVRKIVREGW